jgi:hypothetical protein
MKPKKIQEMIIQAFNEAPETIGSNAILWSYIAKHLTHKNNILTADSFILASVQGIIPSQHTIAAAASNVRKLYPEFQPTEEQLANKNTVREEFINASREAQLQRILNQN